MASKLLRRSGVAVGLIAELLDWKPAEIWQVGVGIHHEEMEVLRQEWNMPKEKIIGYEANYDVYRAIRDTYPGILFNKALSNYIGESTLVFSPRHSDGSTLKGLDNQMTIEQPVSVSTLDAVGETQVEPGALLWLDCEGSELDVLRGGHEFLKSVDVVNVEVTGHPFGTGWCKPVDVYLFLKQIGFQLQHIHTQRTTAGQFDAVFVRPHLFQLDYCCCFVEMLESKGKVFVDRSAL